MIEQAVEHLPVVAPVLVVACLLSFGLAVALRPWFMRYAMARPNARSSHRTPTPQGGGIAVVTATLAAAWGATLLSPVLLQSHGSQWIAVTVATVLLAVVGAVDDVRPLPELVRLGAQFIAVGAVIAALPSDFQIVPELPHWLERGCLLLGGVWLVNLVNFMDGVDWMTVAELVPITATLVLLGLGGTIAPLPTVVTTALLGGMLGFAPLNKPVARLFLGDVGSLPIGLLLGWLLLHLAGTGYRTAALLLPLYYLADATITLGRRIVRREPFWQAHRSHFYQRATDNGFAIPQIVARVFLVNLVLAALALVSVAADSAVVSLLVLALGAASVAALLFTFASARL